MLKGKQIISVTSVLH